MTTRLSHIAAANYLFKYPSAVTMRARTGRLHLVDKGRPECGSPLSTAMQEVWLPDEKNVRWCYSCIGNAIERMETE